MCETCHQKEEFYGKWVFNRYYFVVYAHSHIADLLSQFQVTLYFLGISRLPHIIKTTAFICFEIMFPS